MKLDIKNLFRILKEEELDNNKLTAEESALLDYVEELNQGTKFDENYFLGLYNEAETQISEQAFMCGFKTAMSLIIDRDKAQQLDELSKTAFNKITNKKGG